MRLILIGGAQRSGTTLLQTLLANALNAPILPEDHILCDLLTSYKRAKDAAKKTHFFYGSNASLLAFFRSCADRHVAEVAKVTSAGSALILKDPNFVQVEHEAFAVFPDAVRIVCLRDPRDITASFLRIGERQERADKLTKYQKRDLHFIGSKIGASYAPLMNGGGPANTILVRYENLVTDPKPTLQMLAREAGLELSLSRIDEPAWLEADARHESSWVSALEGQKPSAASVGAYKTVMHPREVAVIEQLCERFMAWAGYEKSAMFESPHPEGLIWGIYKRLRRVYWAALQRPPGGPPADA